MTYRTPRSTATAPSRATCPLGVRIDASGGWWDAGDYLKFVHATATPTRVLLTGVRDFPAQMGAGRRGGLHRRGPVRRATGSCGCGTTARARSTTRSASATATTRSSATTTSGGCRRPTTPTAGTTRRSATSATGRCSAPARPGSPVSPNLAGRDAAAFALCYQVYRTTDPAFARQLPARRPSTSSTSPTRRRRAADDGDPVRLLPGDRVARRPRAGRRRAGARRSQPAALPAGPAAHATRASTCEQAAHWAHAYITGPNDAADTLNLYDVSGLAHYELNRAITQAGDPRASTSRARPCWPTCEGARRRDRAGRDRPVRVRLRVGQWDTTTHGTGLSVMASEYDELTGTRTYAARRIAGSANVLGANAWGLSLIVGDGTTFPHCMQHQVANIAGSLDGTAPVLAGASVEGPNSGPRAAGSRTCGPARRTAATPSPVQLERGLPRQRGVLLDRRAGDRPDGDEPARLRPGRGGQVLALRRPRRRGLEVHARLPTRPEIVAVAPGGVRREGDD